MNLFSQSSISSFFSFPKILTLTFLLGNLFFLVTGCYDDPFQEFIGKEDLYYSFDQEHVTFVNNLNINSFTTSYPELATNTATTTDDYVFLYQHRDEIYYLKNINLDFKEYDFRLFIVTSNVTATTFGYTNSDLVNVNVYYYKILNTPLTISNGGHLYFSNNGGLVSGTWTISGIITNQGLNINFDQTFSRAKYENSQIVLE